jgi:hypothetical protein
VGVELIIERADYLTISIDEWRQLVTSDPDLRFRTEPYCAVNPQTGDRIVVPPAEADTELHSSESWEPFLWFDGGRLALGYRDRFDDPQIPVRLKIVAIAQRLGAVVRSDASDELIQW